MIERQPSTNHCPYTTLFRSEARPQWPILIWSGRAAPDPARMPKHAEFIARPFTGEDILDRLQRLMHC